MTKPILISLILLLIFSCDDNPVDDNHEKHVEIVGFQILKNDSILIDHKDNSLLVSDTLAFSLTDTNKLEISFYNENGELVNPIAEEHDANDHSNEEISLDFRFIENGVESKSSQFFSVELPEQADHNHEAETHLPMNVLGKLAGSSAFKIIILHADHPDFESAIIAVKIK